MDSRLDDARTTLGLPGVVGRVALCVGLASCIGGCLEGQRPTAAEGSESATAEGSPMDGSAPPESTTNGRSTDGDPPRETSSAGDTGTVADASDGTDDTGDTGEPVDPGPPFELVELDAPHQAVAGTRGPGQAWADVDGDGWLDLLTVGGDVPSRLWHNEGDGSFAPVPEELEPYLDTVGATFADYDNDGDPDLYLLRKGANVLLRNDGGVLVDHSEAAGVADPSSPGTVTWGDYDGDGWLDLYVANAGIDADVLYHNEAGVWFTQVEHLLPGREKLQAYGATFSDFDDDGDVDLYVANDKQVGNQMWRNDGPGCGGWCFTNVSEAWSADLQADSMGVAVGDFDNDLDLDLSVTDNNRHNILRNGLEAGPIGFADASAEVGVLFDAFGWGTIFFDYDNDGWLDLYVADGNLAVGTSSRLFHNEGGTFSDATVGCECTEQGWGFGVSYADYDHDGDVDFIVGNRGSRHDLYRNRAQSGRHWLTVQLQGGGPVNRDAVGARVWVTTTAGTVLMREVKLGSSVASQNSLRLHFGLGEHEVDSVQVRWPDGTIDFPTPPATDTLWVHGYPGA